MRSFVFLFLSCWLPAVPSLASATVIQLSDEMCQKPGRQVPEGELATPADLALDTYCAALVIKRSAPGGVITVFGSSRTKAEDAVYIATRKFAYLWTKQAQGKFPIATGGGPGLMEAANRGAKEAGGTSIGFASYLGTEKANPYTTDGYLFASFSQREAELVDRARGVLIATGGFGTEWEIFEVLSKIVVGKKKGLPVVFLGKAQDWASLIARIQGMAKNGTISASDVNLVQIAETPEAAVKKLSGALP